MKKWSLTTALFLAILAVQAQAATTWYLSPSGSDSAACTQAAPCKSLNTAYQKASSGDSIQMASGSYGSQTLASASKTSDIVAAPASGATVSFGNLTVNGATHLEIQNVTATGYTVNSGSYITLRNVTINGGLFYLGGSNLSVIGGSIGPGVDFHSQIAPANGWGSGGNNFLFDGVLFHDFTRTSTDVHIECLQVAGTSGMIIRNSKFKNCDVFDLSFTSYNNSGSVSNLTLENNEFATAGSGGYFAVNLQAISGTMVARFNSSTQAWVVQGSGALANTGQMTFTGNNIVGGILDGSSGSCVGASGSATYNYNITQGVKCGSTDKNAAPSFSNASGLDLSLTSSAAAIDFVPLTVSGPSKDINGNARPQGNGYDAGAVEYGSGTSSAPPAPTGLSATVQ